MTNLRTAAQQALEALDAALSKAEPVQEPVVWTLTKTLDKRETTTNGYLWFSNPQNSSWTPLYIARPRREMVPLTEEEIDAEWHELDGEASALFKRVIRKFARGIEKASWEKNNGQA